MVPVSGVLSRVSGSPNVGDHGDTVPHRNPRYVSGIAAACPRLVVKEATTLQMPARALLRHVESQSQRGKLRGRTGVTCKQAKQRWVEKPLTGSVCAISVSNIFN